ncbi:UDP-N-acetylglucosamine--N-acetylmuramyl-(pentapeptide) pyrophosphoryl-undecaprenol N-acetylglucosamine transferase [Canibacter zhoujuaniae]|uniref:UDP-N-acetylglucosamine--N-acetylmuramyl- (pentapeptide) pyrophosphoryl-undecaprenol N-acetylglucosamine transferase n=1 Tax=Canibacter zhoujuaniae TaxID=2708343 RepID=UPI00142292C8|nr:UDP-N-acetylglucosamine--N-acetylmuramyl-(pentapeptide) pyrophosphoryl-undecaprenol N-acetylglucosamine transferase [Canibacter zhoujuaniae]
MTVYLLAGGGTAGHVNPLLALAEVIRERDPHAEIIALGTLEGLESRLVPERGFELVVIPRLPFPRRPNAAALKFPAKYRSAVQQVRQLIRHRGVDVVVGFGGYAASPAYSAARKEGVPIVIHEANAKPGLANKLGARYTDFVAVTFANTPLKNARVTGMPLRREIEALDRRALRKEACAHFGLDAEKPTLLVTGGSLGAKGINEGVSQNAQEIIDSGAQVLHIWGGLTELKDPNVPGYQVLSYCDRMDLAFSAAHLIVSRAGSTTVSEIAGLGIPAIFAPYRHGNGEQALNCQVVVQAGGALMVEDQDLTTEFVRHTLIPLLHDSESLEAMSQAAKTVGVLDGAEQLFALVSEALAARNQ